MIKLASWQIETRFGRAVLVCSVVIALAASGWLWLSSDFPYREETSFGVYRTRDGVTATAFSSNVTRSWQTSTNQCGANGEVRPWKPWLESFGLACVEIGISNEEMESVNVRLNLLAVRESAFRRFFLVSPILVGLLGGLAFAGVANLLRLLIKWIANAPK